jgi:putative heme-binding domain-containing protein
MRADCNAVVVTPMTIKRGSGRVFRGQWHESIRLCTLESVVSTLLAAAAFLSRAADSCFLLFPARFQIMKSLSFSLVLAVSASILIASTAWGQERKGKRGRNELPPDNGRPPQATPIDKIKVMKDFRVELLYSVPRPQGSWVSMCVDPQGRLIVSDQSNQGLFRVTPPPLGGDASQIKVESLPIKWPDDSGLLSGAQGLLWAFDSLYVMVNSRDSALYRVRDTNGDGELDKTEQLRSFQGGGGEHGPHAVLLAPDGKSLFVVCGNQTRMTEFLASRVPPIWGEDHLLPRMPDGNGFMRGVLGPGGTIYQVDPEGKNWIVNTVGFRNEYDAAFNRYGDLFAYDADMEWDFNTPWYRPTRICFAASGAEFGWRNGAGKWPPYFPDSLPAAVNIGPGSPTGVTFGYGAKFPAKYQEAMFINDWSYGKLYAVHLEADGAGYKGNYEEFVSGTPLPLTDIVVRPQDGALYFAIGGRGTQSGLYRVTYVGSESTAASRPNDVAAEARATRRKLEAFHGKKDPAAIEAAWPYLGNSDRYLRYAARVAIEHQDPAAWRANALAEKDPQAAIYALLALVRVSGSDPYHRTTGALPPLQMQNDGVADPSEKDKYPTVDEKLKSDILAALARLDWAKLTSNQRLDLVRVYHVLFNRLGRPDPAAREKVLARFEPLFPAKGREINDELCQLLVYLRSPSIVGRTLALLEAAPTQEEQIAYVRNLRNLKTGWTIDQRKQYFTWFLKAGSYKGGNSLAGFFRNMKNDAMATLTPAEMEALKPILEATPEGQTVTISPPRPFVKKWTLDELLPMVEKGLTKRDFDHGRAMFAAANCFACHRFASEGGSFGPDLSGLAGRFSVKDLLESVVDPSKVISDQYQAVVIRTTDGRTVTGRIINLQGDNMTVNTDMLNPGRGGSVGVRRSEVEEMQPSKTSMMPNGLLDTMNENEALDLLAFLLSRGERDNSMFQ